MTAPAWAWQRYAARAQPRRKVNAAGATTWLNWTQYPDHGPDESLLGELRGRRVLELGSGSGANLAHLATRHAHCVGVDLVPARTATARHAWGHLPNLEFITSDANDYLTTSTQDFDIVYSIFGAVWFTDPALLLPLVRARMTPRGVFAFSHLPLTTEPAVSAGRAITRWDYAASEWVRILMVAGFRCVTADIIPPPVADQPGTLLVRALAAYS